MEIKIDSILKQKYSNKKPQELPNEIQLNKEVSWMIGFWIGDNWSNREGSVIKNNKRSSGKFGINNNDKENIVRFKKGLRNQFKIKNIKIDVQIPRNLELKKEIHKKRASRSFGVREKNINVYFGSPWRKKIGYAIYTNNTVLLRVVTNEIYRKLPKLIEKPVFEIGSLMQGIADSEGTVDKANKLIGISNKDVFVLNLISKSLRRLKIDYLERTDRDKKRIEIKELEKFQEKIGLSTKRKQKELSEMISGNFTREKDMLYLRMFKNELKKGTTAKDVSKKLHIPLSTVKLALKNLFSGKHIERKRVSKHYVYMFPRACLTKREAVPEKR